MCALRDRDGGLSSHLIVLAVLICSGLTACKKDAGLIGAPKRISETKAASVVTPPSPVDMGRDQPQQAFVFDGASGVISNVNGPLVGTASGFVPIQVGGNSSAYGRYANVMLTFPAEYKWSTIVAVEESKEGAIVGEITIAPPPAPSREWFVSPDYVVFAGQSRSLGADGPFANLRFICPQPNDLNSLPVGSTLILARNGVEIVRSKLPATRVSDPSANWFVEGGASQYNLDLKRVSSQNDVVAWRIEDATGKSIRHASLGFPMRGAASGSVEYRIQAGQLGIRE